MVQHGDAFAQQIGGGALALHGDQCLDPKFLIAAADLTAVAGAGAKTGDVGIDHDNLSSPPGQSERGRQSGKAGSDNQDVDAGGKCRPWTGRRSGCIPPEGQHPYAVARRCPTRQILQRKEPAFGRIY